MATPKTRVKEPDLSGTHLWLVLMKAYRALQGVAVRSIESAECGLSDFGVLELLLHTGPQPVNTIGRRIALTSGAITIAIDRLEARGFVQREVHETDRRARMVCLTAKGRSQAAALFAAHKAVMDSAAKSLSKSERATLLTLLKKLGTSAESNAAPQSEQ